MRAAITRHPVVAYFTLTFVISWSGMLLAIGGLAGIPVDPQSMDRLLPAAIGALLLGPVLASVLLIGVIEGRQGLRDLLARMTRWRVRARWYAVASLLAPAVFMGLLLLLSRFSDRFVPTLLGSADWPQIVITSLATGLAAGLLEEPGWTGFATPRLMSRHGILATGLLVGFPWAVWHVLPALWMSGMASGRAALLSYLLDPFLFLVGFRVLIVWVYARTGSLLIAMLMHASLTFSARAFSNAPAGVQLMIFDVAWTVVIWCIVVAILARARGRKPARPAREARAVAATSR